jgi:hypothetical protein
MKQYPLSLVQIAILLVFVAIADVFTYVQGYVVPYSIRPVTYLLFVIVVLLVYFFIVKPKEWMALAGTLALILGVLAIILVIIQDVVIAYQISYRTPIILLGAVIEPYIAGYLYVLLTRPKR